MLPSPTTSLFNMRVAIAYTMAALNAAAQVDRDLSDDDKAAMAQCEQDLRPHLQACTNADRSLEDFDVFEGTRCQARVIMGDVSLDRCVRRTNAVAKVGLERQPGLDASHIFGPRVDDIAKAPLREEPSLVLQAVDRMGNVADFPQKDELRQELVLRSTMQRQLLDDRDEGAKTRSKLQSAASKAATEASDALARTKALLDLRFPRQRAYVASFFSLGSRPPNKRPSVPPPPPNGDLPQP